MSKNNNESLTANHPAIKLLIRRLEDGTITPNMKAAAIHASDPTFLRTNSDNFRNAVKKYRKKLGLSPTAACKVYISICLAFILTQCKDLFECEAKLDTKCTEQSASPGSAKKRKMAAFTDDEEELDSDDDFGNDHLNDQGSFRPMVSKSIWNEPHTTTRRLSLCIVLPSGVNAGDFSVCVLEGGMYVELKCKWPQELVNIQLLHRKWLFSEGEDKIESYHPKLLGFEQFFKDLRKRATDSVESTCRIALPFPVETHMDSKYNLQWRGSSTKLVYVNLRSAVEQYGITNETEEFETV